MHSGRNANPALPKKTCSMKCTGKLAALNRGQKIQELVTFTCTECKKPFTKKKRNTKSNHTYEFCGRKCSSIAKSRSGAGLATNEKRYEYWLKKYGPKIAQQKVDHLNKCRSEQILKYNAEREYTDELKEKIAEGVRNCGFIHPWTDKTLEEAVGPERAAQISGEHSKKLLDGFKSGRLVPVIPENGTWGQPQMTSYGFRVRSKNELYFVQRLEELGLIWNQDWFYERKEDRVPYWDPVDEQERIYYPDFNVRGEIIEIKEGTEQERNDPIVQAKERAALKAFDNYSIVVRRKIKKWLPKFLLETVQST